MRVVRSIVERSEEHEACHGEGAQVGLPPRRCVRDDLAMIRRGTSAALVLVSLASACRGVPATEVLVHIDAQPAAAAQARTLALVVFDHEGARALETERMLGGAATDWPLVLPLVPRGGDGSRSYAVEATIADAAGTTFGWVRGRGTYAAGELREVALCFEDACRGNACGDTATDCVGGPDGGSTSCRTCGSATCREATLVPLAPGSASTRCPAADCFATEDVESVCSDGLDSDCDGALDCADPDCDGDACAADGRVCGGGTCLCSVGTREDTIALCRNGVDDDCDGLVDCAEFECTQLRESDACADNADNDCDGEVDCADADCANQACGGGQQMRCCDRRCVNTWDDTSHCGGCETACPIGRICVRVRDVDGVSLAPGAACRCDLSDTCPRTQECRTLDGQQVCDCTGTGGCLAAQRCVLTGAMHHNYCEYL